MPTPRSTAFRIELPALAALGVGSVIAALVPFDLAFAFMTRGSAVLRALALPVIGLAGLAAAGRVGLRFRSKNLTHPVAAPVLVAALVALGVSIVDGYLCRGLLSESYVQLLTTVGLGTRLLYFMLRAFNENIIYRLFAMSSLVWIVGLFWHDANQRPATGAFWAGIVLAQVINISINVVATSIGPITPSMLCYDAIRYIVPGVLWGYLYWRHGFVTAEIASVGTHPFLQPLLAYLLTR